MPETATPPPVATPPPSPTQFTSPEPAKSDVSIMNDPDLEKAAFGDGDPFQKLDEKVKPKPATPEPEKKPEAAKPDEKKDKTTPAPSPEKKKDKPEPAGLVAHKEQLLNELKEERRIRKELEAERDKLKTGSQDSSKLAQEIAASKKESERLQAELRAARFEVDDKFKAQYVKPLERHLDSVKTRIAQLKVITGIDEATQEKKTRPASYDDFLQLYNMTDGDMVETAERMFGSTQARLVEKYVFDARNLVEQREVALQEERTNWQSRKLEEETAAIREKEAIGEMWTNVNKDLAAKHPEWFGEIEGDEDGNKLLKEGYELVDSAYNNQSLTPQQKVVLDANIRHRAASFPRAQYMIAKRDARIAELEEKLGGKKSSAPGAVRREGDGTTPVQQKGVLDDDELAAAFNS